jgi:WD40 repeat protein
LSRAGQPPTNPRLLLWDLDTGMAGEGARLPSEVKRMAFTPDGNLLVSGDAKGIVRLRELPSLCERSALDWGVGSVQALAVAPDGMTAAAAGLRQQIVIWDLDSL